MRGSDLVRSESESRFPATGDVKQGCDGRLTVMLKKGAPQKCLDDSAFDGVARLRFSVIASHVHLPNKALEPTPPSVTDRAAARSAPAGVVAHL